MFARTEVYQDLVSSVVLNQNFWCRRARVLFTGQWQSCAAGVDGGVRQWGVVVVWCQESATRDMLGLICKS